MTVARQRSPLVSLAGLILFLGLAALPLGRWLAPGDEMMARFVREGIWWAIGVGALAWVLFVERLDLGSIGLRALRWKGSGSGSSPRC